MAVTLTEDGRLLFTVSYERALCSITIGDKAATVLTRWLQARIAEM